MAKVVLVGYGQMLYSLIEGVMNSKHKILGVFRTDRLHHSNLKLFFKDVINPSKDYTVIKSNNLYDIKGSSVNSKKFLNEIKKLNPDLIIVGSWGEKFGKEILTLSKIINFHPALLPRNRGANPYFWTIYKNQKVTGLTAHFMNEKFDRGDIILQEAITINDNETGQSLKDKTTRLAKLMIKDVLDLYDTNQIQPIKQNESYASYEPQISFENMLIDLNKSKTETDRHLRALYPWANPYIKLKERYIKIKNAKLLDIDEESKDINPYEILENKKDFFTIKGSDFILRVPK